MSRKINLKKPLKLMEEFGGIGPMDNTTATETNTAVKVDQKGQTGAEIRAEIIADVDTILTNLETLSKQITEEVDNIISEFENVCNDIINEEYVAVNEDFMADVMKQVNSMKAYGKLKGGYAKYKKNVLKAELKKEQALQEFEFSRDEKKEKLEQGIKDKFQAAIDKVNQSDAPAVKKKADRDRIRAERDKVISDGAKSVELKLTAAKEKLTKTLDAKVRDMNTKLTELQSDNKIESELMAKQWAKEKLAIDDQHEIDVIDKKLEIQSKFQEDNPEFQEKKAKKQKEIQARIKKESAAKKAELEQDLKDAQAQMDAEAERGSEKEKEARAKITAFLQAGNTYINFLNGVDFEAMEDEETGKDLRKQKKDLSKAYSDAQSGVSVSTFKNATEGTSEEDAEEQYTSFTKSVGDAIEEFKDKLDAIDFDDDGEDQTKSAQDVALDSLGDAIGEYTKITDPEEEVTTTNDAGEEVTKKKWTDIKRFKGKDKEGKDTTEEVIYAKPNSSESAGIANGTDLNEGMHPKIKKAMKAVANGETVYGENIRFPGRFKIIEIDKGGFATVDYEDGTDPMQMAAMNIAIDSLSFESAEVEEGNAFGAARAEAIAKGEKTFKVGDEEYDVESVDAEDKENAEEYAEEEGIATEAVTESASFKLGSVADRFKSLM